MSEIPTLLMLLDEATPQWALAMSECMAKNSDTDPQALAHFNTAMKVYHALPQIRELLRTLADKPAEVDETRTGDAADTYAANAIIPVYSRHRANFRKAADAGVSASMNTSMDYMELDVIAKLREIGWAPMAERE